MRSIHRENGFTVVELAIVVILIGVALGIISLSYANTSNNLALKSAETEAEAMMERAYNIALEEGVGVYLAFWDNGGAHKNMSAIYRVYPDGLDEFVNDTPTEPPPVGMSSESDGSGHYWVKMADGSASVQSSVTLFFNREGSLVTVNPVPEGGDMSVTLVVAGRTITVSINDRGEVTTSM
ncbi:MAG: hypothetical protein JW854_13535 [Actinobacteria bacterium]|nr:hypothetical protein [Actinomycetota bacterium]